MAIIEADGLVKYYGDHTVVKDVSFDVQRGEIFGTLGPNGQARPLSWNVLRDCESRTVEPSESAVSIRWTAPVSCDNHSARNCRKANCPGISSSVRHWTSTAPSIANPSTRRNSFTL